MGSGMKLRGSTITVDCEFPLVTGDPDGLLRTHVHFQRALACALKAGDSGDVKFNLSDCDRIDVGALLLLLYAACRIRDQGWTPWISASKASKGKAFEIVAENLDHLRMPRDLRSQFNKRAGAFLLRAIRSRKEMVGELLEWALSVKEGTEATDEEVAHWQQQISEVTTNGFQHALSDADEHPIYVAGQASPGTAFVELSAIDLGRGIPTTLRRAMGEELKGMQDGDVVSYACKKGVTARSDRTNQGLGLFDLVEQVKQNKGSLQILSGNGLARVENGRKSRRNLLPVIENHPVLSGTLTNLRLRIPWRPS